MLQSISSTKGRLGSPWAPGSIPASQTMVLPRCWMTQHDLPTSWPAPSMVTETVSESEGSGTESCGGVWTRLRPGGSVRRGGMGGGRGEYGCEAPRTKER